MRWLDEIANDQGIESEPVTAPRNSLGDLPLYSAPANLLKFQAQTLGAKFMKSAPRDLGRKLRAFERSRPPHDQAESRCQKYVEDGDDREKAEGAARADHF